MRSAAAAAAHRLHASPVLPLRVSMRRMNMRAECRVTAGGKGRSSYYETAIFVVRKSPGFPPALHAQTGKIGKDGLERQSGWNLVAADVT
jgi:hypothetical protein